MDALTRIIDWLLRLFAKPSIPQLGPQPSGPIAAPQTEPDVTAETWLDVCEPFTKGWEGCRLTAWLDTLAKPPVWTVGFGATGEGITQGTVWTQAQADADLRARLAVIGDQIDHTCPVVLTDNQKAALADFAYNEGIGRLTGSDIYLHLKDRDPAAAMKELLAYDKAGGAYVQGLENRRIAEARLFDT